MSVAYSKAIIKHSIHTQSMSDAQLHDLAAMHLAMLITADVLNG